MDYNNLSLESKRILSGLIKLVPWVSGNDFITDYGEVIDWIDSPLKQAIISYINELYSNNEISLICLYRLKDLVVRGKTQVSYRIPKTEETINKLYQIFDMVRTHRYSYSMYQLCRSYLDDLYVEMNVLSTSEYEILKERLFYYGG